MRWNALVVSAIVLASGCGVNTSSMHTISHADDGFSRTIDGRTVSYAKGKLTVDGKTIDVPPGKSTIQVHQINGKILVTINEKTVYQE